jgi:uncharacterized protein
MKDEITYLGKIINVNSNTVEVEISKKIPSSAPIINGRVFRIGQIGTLVKIVVGQLNIFGIVSSVSNCTSNSDLNIIEPDKGSRYLQIQLIGEKLGNSKFVKGIGTYPTINDEVHLVIEDDLKAIYGEPKNGFIEIGKHSSSENLPVCINLNNLILRHSAILGSTGSGKSNTTANIIKSVLNDYIGSRIVLVDPHGEYESAFKGIANILKIDSKSNPLYIPFWTMTFDELSFFLVGREVGQERPEDKKLREKVLELKKLNASKLKAGLVKEEYITSDSPIPFDIRQMWHDFYRQVYSTHNISIKDKQTKDTEELVDEGDPKELIPPKFKPYSMGSTAPYKSQEQTMYSYEGKIHSRLRD